MAFQSCYRIPGPTGKVLEVIGGVGDGDRPPRFLEFAIPEEELRVRAEWTAPSDDDKGDDEHGLVLSFTINDGKPRELVSQAGALYDAKAYRQGKRQQFNPKDLAPLGKFLLEMDSKRGQWPSMMPGDQRVARGFFGWVSCMADFTGAGAGIGGAAGGIAGGAAGGVGSVPGATTGAVIGGAAGASVGLGYCTAEAIDTWW